MGGIKALRDLNVREKGRVMEIRGSGSIRRRLMDMGVVKGSEVEVVRVAPLGDPIDVKIKGYHLSLRKADAADIYVEVGE